MAFTQQNFGASVDLEKYRSEILHALRGRSKTPLHDEDAAWLAVLEAIVSPAAQTLDSRIYTLGLIYAVQTGAMPGYTNSDNETRFERFANAVLAIVEPKTTRHQLRSAIRRLGAKSNGRFRSELLKLSAHKQMKAAE